MTRQTPRRGDGAALEKRLAEAHPELVVDESSGLSFAFGNARIVLALGPATAPGTQVRGRTWGLAYRIEGALSEEEAGVARARLLAVAETFCRIESEIETEVDSIEDLEARCRDRIRPSARLLSDPSLLVDAVDRMRRAVIDGGPPVLVAGLPPCLDLDMRPEPRALLVDVSPAPLVAPCDDCGSALVCPANAEPRSAPSRPLRVLRHHDATAAAWTCLHAIATSFERPIPERAIDALVRIFAARAGVLAVPPVPLEFSIKRSSSALLPRLRFVDYSPRSRRELPAREARAPRRKERLVELSEALGSAEARGWVALLAREQPPGLELSIGVDADLMTGEVRSQLYAHIEPSDKPRMLGALRSALTWSRMDERALLPILDLANEVASEVVLIGHAPAPNAPRRIKVYWSRRLQAGHEASGLEPASLGALAAFAPARGLAVLSCEPGTVRWEKWDFPCAAHYQRARGLVAAFGEGLPEDHRALLETLLDGRLFAPWATWASVGHSENTLYFIPR